MPTITSTQIAFVDTTDNRKLECNIASNLPTVQVYDRNAGTYSPDWSINNNHLTLSSTVYLDATNVTNPTSPASTTYVWYCKYGSDAETQISTNRQLIINSNITHNSGVVTYRCVATYKVNSNDTGITATSSITFSRTTTGLNGTNGSSAPAVIAQYSANGTSNWTTTLNTSTHKYIRLSYDNGSNWTAAIKIAGEDGTSITIEGSYDTYAELVAAHSTGSAGDSYIVDGDLYIWDTDTSEWKNIGNIQGQPGNDGTSSYMFVRYATDAVGSNMSVSPSGKTYIGIAITSINTAPELSNAYTWSKYIGDNAKSIILNADAQVFKISNTNVVTPSTIVVTAQTLNTTVTTWTYSVNGGQSFLSTPPTGVSRNGTIVTVTGSTLVSNSLTIKATDGTYSDTLTIYKAFDGADGNPGAQGSPAPLAFLTNENITFAANAEGKITGTSFTTNVVGYNGATKVTPVIGAISGLHTGMTYGGSTTVGNELILSFTIANNATFGSASNINGSFTIPVTSPVATNLKLNWSKVNSGRSVSSIVPRYAVSESNTIVPDIWQSTIPTRENGQYLWMADYITYDNGANATVGARVVTGDAGSDGISIDSIVAYFANNQDTNSPPTSEWGTTPHRMTNYYTWRKDLITYSDGTSEYTTPVCITGDKGDQGVSPINVEIVSSVGNLYINNNISTTLTAKVYQRNIDITNEFPDSAFLWEKYDIDGVKDPVWSYTGKSVQISNADIWKRAMFNCIVDIEERF